ncbi:MAG: SAM-dependent methyltransferase, partial [Oscillospiraceae bacterium]|nr:SAM-dependent methyltransferase [Oscillospiraceae bacterium]
LYYYFTVKRGMNAKIIGYDLKEDVVEHCNAVAQKYGYDGLRFVHADVTRDVLYDEPIDMIVTLHACDTATDYALHYALKKRAKYIFSVPCCQHEVNKTIKKGGELDIFMSHGIIKERMSALLTDAVRAAVLEDMGYKVDMIEFIDFEHSPKNLMIRAAANGAKGERRIKSARAMADKYGFRHTLLELVEKEKTEVEKDDE